MHTHIDYFFIKWGLVRNKGALPFCRLWSQPAKDESFIFSRYCLLLRYISVLVGLVRKAHKNTYHVVFAFNIIPFSDRNINMKQKQ